MHITFRTDASTQIGTGHIMRCLTLADALKEQGAICHFICREHEGNLIELIKNKGHAVTALDTYTRHSHSYSSYSREGENPLNQLVHAHWLGTTQEDDAQQCIATMQSVGPGTPSNHKADWLIVDHYALDTRWERELKPHCHKLMVIDDLADRVHDCDLLLDQNLGKARADYQALVPEHCALLLGPTYALLQPEYAELHPRTPPRQGPIKNILVYFGGSDQHDLTGMAVQAFLQLDHPDIQLSVVMGSSYPHKEKLQQLAQAHSHIQLYQNLPSLAPLMLEADLAIGASGSTSWERCCLGLPAIIITLADNQIPIAEALHQAQLTYWLGNAEEASESKITQALNHFIGSNQELTAYSERGLNLTKGHGTAILTGYMLLNKQTQLHARLAALQDETLLLNWANDPHTRQNSFNTAPITPEQHRQWFYQKLRQPTQSKIYILETQNQLPVGQVRFDWQEEKQAWQINYLLAPAARGNGLASRVLEQALQKLRSANSEALVFGEVKQENIPSQKAFKSLHFNEERAGGVLLFARMLIAG